MSDGAVTAAAVEVPGHERGHQQNLFYTLVKSKLVHAVEDGAGHAALAESRGSEHAADVRGLGIGEYQVAPTGGLAVDLGDESSAILRAGQFGGKGFEIGEGCVDQIHLPGIAHHIDGKGGRFAGGGQLYGLQQVGQKILAAQGMKTHFKHAQIGFPVKYLERIRTIAGEPHRTGERVQFFWSLIQTEQDGLIRHDLVRRNGKFRAIIKDIGSFKMLVTAIVGRFEGLDESLNE